MRRCALRDDQWDRISNGNRRSLNQTQPNVRFGARPMFHNNGSATRVCRRKAKMSALSKVEMSVSAPFWEFGGCHFDGHGGDEQARAKPS